MGSDDKNRNEISNKKERNNIKLTSVSLDNAGSANEGQAVLQVHHLPLQLVRQHIHQTDFAHCILQNISIRLT